MFADYKVYDFYELVNEIDKVIERNVRETLDSLFDKFMKIPSYRQEYEFTLQTDFDDVKESFLFFEDSYEPVYEFSVFEYLHELPSFRGFYYDMLSLFFLYLTDNSFVSKVVAECVQYIKNNNHLLTYHASVKARQKLLQQAKDTLTEEDYIILYLKDVLKDVKTKTITVYTVDGQKYSVENRMLRAGFITTVGYKTIQYSQVAKVVSKNRVLFDRQTFSPKQAG